MGKVEQTIKIRARAARPASTKKVVKTVCDFCGKKSADYYGNERKCMVCRRDICQAHQTYDPNESGDYGGHYCPICIGLLSDKYQALYDSAEEEYDKVEDAITLLFRQESLATPTTNDKSKADK